MSLLLEEKGRSMEKKIKGLLRKTAYTVLSVEDIKHVIFRT